MKELSKRLLIIASASAVFAVASSSLFAAENPKEVRIGVSSAGVGGKPRTGGGFTANAQVRSVLENEFKKDGIKVVWNLFPGAGPATNEAFANKKVDFGLHGDLPLIVGRSTGLKHKIILTTNKFGPVYVTVPADSSAKSVTDLKGKTWATHKGTATQLSVGRVLRKYGLEEKDIRLISQDPYSQRTSLSTGDIDAAVITPWALAARGVAKPIVEIRRDPLLSTPSTLWVGEEFEKKYPHIVQRVVTTLVKEAHWASQEANRDGLFKIWAQSGNPYDEYRRDFNGYKLIERVNPVIDDYYVAALTRAIGQAKDYKLIRRDVSLNGWIERKYLDNALKQLNLENYWPKYDANGKHIAGTGTGLQ
ncbi:ABC transporter substrate-binding protein [Acinetobacter sp. NIPH 2699]|uniref:ABC transporter substrate-binding protein n=1 Tax=Acinetobacter sp. NIPH 2699 TaxID=2923433 RepID=UPI001F4A8323|nr:ABC transporter substrate-binding protein [Acinetobacter sp. NIPH 2699]MCH7336271.1 ABC transporter substrate-binding protein [Acinetobacter sp. NIPH 2699]